MTTNNNGPKFNWPEDAIYDLEHSDLSLGEIAKKYNRDRSTVAKMQTRQGIVRQKGTKRRGNVPAESLKTLGVHHRALGARITRHRGNTGPKEYAAKIGISHQVLQRMEHGTYDYPLSQLLLVVNFLGVGIEEALRPHTVPTR